MKHTGAVLIATAIAAAVLLGAARLQAQGTLTLEALSELIVFRGVPGHIRPVNGPEFTARAVREWLGRVGARTLYIGPGSPWENGYIESLNGKLRDELLEVRVLTECNRRTYNRIRQHSFSRLPAVGA